MLKDICKLYIKSIDKISDSFGFISKWLTTILVLIVCFDVGNRYIFGKTNPAMYEAEWHIYSLIFLLGASYALKFDKHVRVDITYTKFSSRSKAWINFFGSIIFLIPFSALMIYSTLDWVYQSWLTKEISPDPGGLPFRFALKACVPLCFGLLLLQGLAEFFKNALWLFGNEEDKKFANLNLD